MRELAESLKGLVALLGLCVAAWGLGILGRQTVGWLKTGAWEKYSAYRAALAWTPRDWAVLDWLKAPRSWFGLHEVVLTVLKSAPASLVLLVAGSLVFAVFIHSMDAKKWRE